VVLPKRRRTIAARCRRRPPAPLSVRCELLRAVVGSGWRSRNASRGWSRRRRRWRRCGFDRGRGDGGRLGQLRLGVPPPPRMVSQSQSQSQSQSPASAGGLGPPLGRSIRGRLRLGGAPGSRRQPDVSPQRRRLRWLQQARQNQQRQQRTYRPRCDLRRSAPMHSHRSHGWVKPGRAAVLPQCLVDAPTPSFATPGCAQSRKQRL
jgi:hypothetical protein